MNCSKCNNVVADGTRFCDQCGFDLSTPPAASEMLAVNAGNQGSAPPVSPGRPTQQTGSSSTFAANANRNDAGGHPPGLVERVKNIILAPNSEWPVIAEESTSPTSIYAGYIAPLAAIGPLASIIGMSVIGISIPFVGTIRTPILSSITSAILVYALAFVGVFILSLIINALAPVFSGEKNSHQALKVAAYAYTPAWLGGIFSLIPMLTMLGMLAGIYSIYLLYTGLPILMKSPKDKAVGYTALVIVAGFVLGIVMAAISATAIGVSGYGMHGAADVDEKQAAATTGAVIGGLLGSTKEDKATIGAAIGGMANLGRQMEQAQAATSAAQNSSPAGASSTPNAAAALGVLGKALNGGKTATPIDFRELKLLLPETIGAMKRTDGSGENSEAVGVRGSFAEAAYRDSGNGRMQIKISDLGSMSGLASMAAALEPVVDKETDTGYEKTSSVNGRHVREKFDRRNEHGELDVLVGNRFQVEVSGNHVDMNSLKLALNQIDLNKLDSMKTRDVKQ